MKRVLMAGFLWLVLPLVANGAAPSGEDIYGFESGGRVGIFGYILLIVIGLLITLGVFISPQFRKYIFGYVGIIGGFILIGFLFGVKAIGIAGFILAIWMLILDRRLMNRENRRGSKNNDALEIRKVQLSSYEQSRTPQPVANKPFDLQGVITGIIVFCVIGFGIAAYEIYENRGGTKAPAVTQQVQPPIQTNSGSGLPPCIGTKLATWTNCTGAANWPDGGTYAGEWRNGKMHGQGTRTLPDGAKYIGEYRDDSPHGQGTLTLPDGSILHSGEWASGKPVDKEPIAAPKQAELPTQVSSGEAISPCSGTSAAGWTYCKVMHTWPDGKKYAGELRDDKPHGQGTMTLPDGSVLHSGLWLDGEPVK